MVVVFDVGATGEGLVVVHSTHGVGLLLATVVVVTAGVFEVVVVVVVVHSVHTCGVVLATVVVVTAGVLLVVVVVVGVVAVKVFQACHPDPEGAFWPAGQLFHP